MKNKVIILIIIIVVAIITRAIIRKTKLKGMGYDKIRSDKQGSGKFNAKRGNRKHEGVDFKFNTGASIFTPKKLEFVRIKYPYAGNTDIQGALYLDEKGNEVTYFYIKPVMFYKKGGIIEKGTILGTAQNISGYYKNREKNPLDGMQNHVHVQVLDIKTNKYIDPLTWMLT